MSEPIAPCARQLRLRSNVSVVTEADGRIVVRLGSYRGENLGFLTSAELSVLHELAARELGETELRVALGPNSFLLRRLRSGGWLTITFGLPGRPLVTVRPLGPHRDPRPAKPVAPRLSRFAVLRRDGDQLTLESPLARVTVVVHDTDVVAVIHHLASGSDCPPDNGLPANVVDELITELAWYGLVHEAEEDVRPDLVTEQWSPHELWFHSRSRAGFHDQPFGRTLWADGRHPPVPVRRETWSGTAVALPTPDSSAPPGPALSAVLEAQRAALDAGQGPLTLAELGEFLHWTARVRPAANDAEDAARALEIYPVVSGVSALPGGMYHYDPFDHVLEPVPAAEFATSQLISRATAMAGGTEAPPVLLVITARFGRVMWTYQSMAYAQILKDLGALMQTMYLVATSMNLVPCALGTGDADLFAQATGLNQLVEASVGEFMLASRPT